MTWAGGSRLENRNGTTVLAEIGENTTSEANFDLAASLVEAPGLIAVTANSSGFSRLDKEASRLLSPLKDEG